MSDASAGELSVFVGTYASDESEGIHVYRMSSTGELERASAVAGVKNPSFLELHPNGRFLYAIGESGGEGEGGTVNSFAIDPDSRALTLMNTVSSVGPGPCHCCVDTTGAFVLAANYGGGSVCMLPIREDGQLDEASDFVQHEGSSVNAERQTGPHAHSIVIDRANRRAFAPDLGLDKILIYELDLVSGKLVPGSPPSAAVAPGAGPRHFDFHPNRKYAYVINEIDNTITAFSFDEESGSLEGIQTIDTLPEGFTGASHTADIHIDKTGRFLYGSNRGHDSIAIYGIDEPSGRLTLIGHESTQGSQPRNFGLDPSGTFLLAANHVGNSIVTFRVDEAEGTLAATGHVVNLPAPVCVKFLTR